MDIVAAFEWSFIWENRHVFLDGLWVTLKVSLVSIAGAFVVGLVLGAARAYRIAVVSQVAAVYVEVIRNTPILVQVFFVYFGLSEPPFNIRLTAFTAGCVTLIIWGGAFNTENFRAGFEAVPARYREAGLALGLSRFMTFLNVTLPIGGRIALPSSINTYISVLKNSALIGPAISLQELTYQAYSLESVSFRATEIYFTLAAIYLAVVWALSALIRGREVARAAGGTAGATTMAVPPAGGCLVVLAGLFPDWAGPVFRYIIETGLPYTLKIAGAAVVGSAVVGIVLGTLLTIHFWPMRALIRLYIEVWRGLPLIVTLFLIVYALPQTVLHLTFQPWVGAAIGLTLWGSAQVAEATRGAVDSIPREQHEAAQALGFGWTGRLVFVVLPQAFRRLLPPLVSLLVNVIQNTTLAALVGVTEILFAAKQQVERLAAPPPAGLLQQHGFAIYGAVLVFFFLISFPLTRLAAYLERRLV